MKGTLTRLLFLLVTSLCFAGCSKNDILPIPNTDEYVAVRIPNSNFNLATPDSIQFSRVNNTNTVTAYNSSSSLITTVRFEGPAVPGQYNVTQVAISSLGAYFVQLPDQDILVNIHDFGTTGQLLTGNFIGMMKDSLQNLRTLVVVNFRVRVP